jgi:hypothetical protein
LNCVSESDSLPRSPSTSLSDPSQSWAAFLLGLLAVIGNPPPRAAPPTQLLPLSIILTSTLAQAGRRKPRTPPVLPLHPHAYRALDSHLDRPISNHGTSPRTPSRTKSHSFHGEILNVPGSSTCRFPLAGIPLDLSLSFLVAPWSPAATSALHCARQQLFWTAQSKPKTVCPPSFRYSHKSQYTGIGDILASH